MTYRVIHTPLHQFWPEHEDVEGFDDAHRLALRLSREHGGEVSVHLLPEEPT